MITGLIVLHVIICIFITVVVLLQFGKGAEAGAMMGSGGASQNVFTTSNRGNFFTKLTTVLSIGFVITSLALSLLMSKNTNQSVLDGEGPVAPILNQEAPAETPSAEVANPPAETTPANTEENTNN